ncbi:MAG: hypothetical protein IPL87_04680 [Candidatus Moraniibacteriota bacterium]|nr:MAG: hypothetical protein IPL87_04680 [Candidatus Moranbacteria bacterium]
MKFQSKSDASGSATLTMTSPQASGGVVNITQNTTFDVDLVVNTAGATAVAVRAIVTYNPADFQLTAWNTSNSIFAVSNTCVYQGKACEIVENDTANGRIVLTLAKPLPGVQTNSGVLGTLTFRGLRTVSSSTNNIVYTFVGADNATDSDVIESGGSNDLLSSATGIRALVGAPLCTSYTYSAWGTCAQNGTQTRTVVSGTPLRMCGGVTPDLTQPCTYVPPTCTSFTVGTWGACQLDNQRFRSVVGVPAGCTGGTRPSDVEDCTYAGGGTTCTSFTVGAWGACQPSNRQFRSVAGVPANCTPASGTTVPSSTQACTYTGQETTCTSFEYSEWGTCGENGKRTRSITNMMPAGCAGGSPVVEEVCGKRKVEIQDEKVSFSSSERILTDSNRISFSGKEETLKGGRVEVYSGKDNVRKSETVADDGSWSLKVREKNSGTYDYRVRYIDRDGNVIATSDKYEVRVDTREPVITDLPLFFNIRRGEKLWWDAEDNQEIDYYRYTFLGKSKETKSKSFNVPIDAPVGMHSFQLTVYDEAGNRTVKRILIRVL